MWAFEVIVPVSIALEQQTWMEDPSLASLWLPGSPAGLCKQCALGEHTCVQVRNRLEMGAPPKTKRPAARSICAAGGVAGGALREGSDRDPNVDSAEWARAEDEPQELDFRSFV